MWISDSGFRDAYSGMDEPRAESMDDIVSSSLCFCFCFLSALAEHEDGENRVGSKAAGAVLFYSFLIPCISWRLSSRPCRPVVLQLYGSVLTSSNVQS